MDEAFPKFRGKVVSLFARFRRLRGRAQMRGKGSIVGAVRYKGL